jgi:hypothetical protein
MEEGTENQVDKEMDRWIDKGIHFLRDRHVICLKRKMTEKERQKGTYLELGSNNIMKIF